MDVAQLQRAATSTPSARCVRLEAPVQRCLYRTAPGKNFTCRRTRAVQVFAAAAEVEEKPAAAAKPAKPVLKKSASGKIDAPIVPIEETVLLQGFGWSSHEAGGWYKIVKDNISTITEGGFTHIWLPPPSQSVAPQGYLPGRLYNLDTPYGNKEQLQDLTGALKQAGVVPVADVVINHRCADVQSEDGTWNKYSDDRDYADNPVDWGRWAITGDDPEFKGKGNPDTGADYGPAPDLDHTNEGLRESLIDWLNWLKDDVGFSGWRFDFVKGYAPDFMNDYIGKTVSQEVFNVGEFWVDLRWGDGLEYDQNAPRQALCDWLDKAGGCTLFDFVTKGILNEAVKNTEYWRLVDQDGKQPGLTGWWPSRSVTFIDNHDTGSTQQHWPFPQGQEEVGYAYIITHPGMPCILWEHYFDYGLKDTINNLIALRKRAGVNATSSLEIVRADSDLYLAKVGEKLLVKLGPRFDLGELTPSEGEGWKVAGSGNNWCVWEKN